MNGNCATYDENRGVTQIGACAYISVKLKKDVSTPLYRLLPENSTSLNEMMCGSMNRAGALCGRCLPDHYPLAYSFNLTCVQCPRARWNVHHGSLSSTHSILYSRPLFQNQCYY